VYESSVVGTYSLLGELLSTLVLGVFDQFHNTTFVGSETSDFTDDAANEGGALGRDLHYNEGQC
jgi:hypothetical protein